jgi:transcriptional regulator NrdR family protein
MSIRRVRKRDGREVPFDKHKVKEAVLAAQAAVGEADDGLAGEVADLVELTLARYYSGQRNGGADEGFFSEDDEAGVRAEAIPDIEEIQDLVEKALIEMGRAAASKAYILYRDRRARARDALTVHATAGQESALRSLRVRESGGSVPWSKARIVAALVEEAELGRELAEEVANRVEERVLKSGTKRLSTTLVRELVDNELVVMGLESALARHEPVALPRHDLRLLLEHGPAALPQSSGPPRVASGERIADGGVEGVIAGEILSRFALDDLLGEAAAERHLAGDYEVCDLGRPHLHLVQAIPAELYLRGQPGARAAYELLDQLAGLCASVSRGLVLEGPAGVLAPLAKGARADSFSALVGWLAALRAVAHSAGRRIDLASPIGRSPGILLRTLEALVELDEASPGGPLPRVFLDRVELRALLVSDAAARAVVERLMTIGALIVTWSRDEERFAGPGCRRRGREQGALACGGAVALNLSRVARIAGPWREDLALEHLSLLVEESVDTLSGLARFQRDHRASRSGEARGRVAYALTPVGLREALRTLGDGELRPQQGARLLGFMSEAARRFSADRGLSVTLTPFFGERAARRFARLDQKGNRASQQLLFGEIRSRDVESGEAYSSGFSLGGVEFASGRAAAELLSTVPVGSWASAAERSAPLRDTEQPLLVAWERFDSLRVQRREGTSSGSDLGSSSATLFQ